MSPTRRDGPDPAPDPPAPTRRIYARVWPHVRRRRGTLLLGLCCGLGFVGASLVPPAIVKRILDETTKAGLRPGVVDGLAIALVGATALAGLFGFLRRYLMIGASRRVEADMRQEVYDHLLRLDHGFFDRSATGDLMSRLTADLEAVRQAYGPGFMYISDTILRAPAAVAVMVTFDAGLTLLALTPLVALTVVVKLLSPRIHRYSRRVQEEESALRARAQESFAGIRVVKSYGQEDHEVHEYATVADRYLAASMGLARTRAVLRPTIMALASTGPVLILLVGGAAVARGELTFGDFIAFNAYYAILIWPMMAVGWVMTLFQRGAAAMRRVDALLDREPEIRDAGAPREIASIRGGIEFRDLTFSYDGEGPALRGIDLRIEPGQTVAIVGPTGLGKSTLVNLVPRLYEAPRGSVLVDGVPVDEIPLSVLRRSIATVPQETFLFSDTIRANIGYGLEREPTEEEILEAASISQVAADVEGFPDGYETLLGERGVNLSGGQKQRVALARAVLLRPPILILDDALSAVDTETEERILGRLRGVMAGRTTLIIGHRVSTVKHADLIVVVDGGRITARGTHDELVAAGGLYGRMHRMQLLEEELEAIE